MLFWHTPTACTASLNEEPSCDRLGIEPSSSSSSTGEGSPIVPKGTISWCCHWNGFSSVAVHSSLTHCALPNSSAENLHVPQSQLLRNRTCSGFPDSQRLMEVGQSVILVPQSPLIDQSNNSALWFPTAHPCPLLQAPGSSLCVPQAGLSIFSSWGISSVLSQPYTHTVKPSITLCYADKAWWNWLLIKIGYFY